jgi:hypothetical protein
MYVDIPAATKEKLVERAAELGMSQKGLLAHLIEQECAPAKRKPATKKRAKKKSKRSRR